MKSDYRDEYQVIVYPVGWMRVWKDPLCGEWRGEWRRMLDAIRKRRWRTVRNMFNGYLAEAQYTSMIHYRCGTGWTKRRALADLGRHLAELNAETRRSDVGWQ